MSERYCDRDAGRCYHSSGILLHHFKKYNNVISPWLLSKLHSYCNLYNSYREKHILVTSLEKKYLSYGNTRNPFKMIKKLKVSEDLLKEYSNIYTTIIEMADIESIKQVQEILEQYNEEHIFGIASEVIGKCHWDKSLYIH